MEDWMKMPKEDHGFHQDFIAELEKSIPVPSTSKDAFFPETEPEKKLKPGVTYSTLSDRMKFYHTPGARRG